MYLGNIHVRSIWVTLALVVSRGLGVPVTSGEVSTVALATVTTSAPVLAPFVTTSTACNQYETKTARFDKVNTGSSLSDGYMNANWDGWQVVNVPDTPSNLSYDAIFYPSFLAKSGAHVITHGETIGVDYPYSIQVTSFSFACARSDYRLGVSFPSGCSILVVASDVQTAAYRYWGPFQWTFGYEAISYPMKRVKINDPRSAYDWRIILIEGSGSVFLDDVVVIGWNRFVNCFG